VNEDLIILVDKIGRAFWERLKIEPDKKGLLVPMGENGFKIPNPCFDRDGWEFFCFSIRTRHNIDAFFNKGEQDHVILYEHGTVYSPPVFSDAEVAAIKLGTTTSEQLAEAEFKKLMQKITGQLK
jgi:hypothetical protein